MARAAYYVVLHEGDWKINHLGKHYGPFKTQEQAIKVAVDTAQKEGQRSPDGAQVLVQGRNNKFRVEWTYGRDPYPPVG